MSHYVPLLFPDGWWCLSDLISCLSKIYFGSINLAHDDLLVAITLFIQDKWVWPLSSKNWSFHVGESTWKESTSTFSFSLPHPVLAILRSSAPWSLWIWQDSLAYQFLEWVAQSLGPLLCEVGLYVRNYPRVCLPNPSWLQPQELFTQGRDYQ